jgi:hypothetical protein
VVEEVTDFARYETSFDGMEDAEDEALLGPATRAKIREAGPDEPAPTPAGEGQ